MHVSQNFVSLTFFIDLQLQDIADLGEDVVREGGQQGDTLQEVHLRDGGMINSADRAVLPTLVQSMSEIKTLLTS